MISHEIEDFTSGVDYKAANLSKYMYKCVVVSHNMKGFISFTKALIDDR